jgi:nucleotide-binding universal stress UspA family protein
MSEKRFTMFGSGPVVVAVDGTEDGVRALKYGVQQALRGGRRLRLVHAPHETMPMAPMMPLFASETLHEMARHVLADAEKQARELGAEDVETVVADGPRVPAILRHAGDASLIVLGPRSSRVRRLLTGSTTSGVAHRATCPVVSVPAAWSPDAPADGVVAGVDDSAHAANVVAAGFAAARERGCGLTVLHAWRPVGQYDAIIVERAMIEPWREGVIRELERLTSTVGAEYPDVPVKLLAEYHATVPALVEASRHAELLVLGRRGSGAPFGLPLGSVARAVVAGAHCPVEVVASPRKAQDDETSRGASTGAGFAPTY